MPILESSRLRLRRLALDDARHLASLFEGDWDALRHTGRVPFPPTEPAVRRWIGGHVGPTSQAFLVLRKDDGRPLGSAGFGGSAGVAELGYLLGRAYWGRGYATEAVQALVDHALALRLRQLDAYSFVDNPASARVLEKAAFDPLGVIERCYPARGGRRKVWHYRKML